MSLIYCDRISVGYEQRPVATDISFCVNSGDYLCIVGENGSGKSTLMKTVLGLQKPVCGKIVYGDGLCAKSIGYLPQQTVVQKDFPASVREIVLSGCQNTHAFTPFYTASDKARAAENMERMGISHLAKKCYRELSGGQQQRVLLARALCATQKLLLLDEPIAGLDPAVTASMYELIDSLNKDLGISVIMITHDVCAIKYAKTVLHIGSEHFFGTREEFLENTESGIIFRAKGGEQNG